PLSSIHRMQKPSISSPRRCAGWARPTKQKCTWRPFESSRLAHRQHLIGLHSADGLPFTTRPPNLQGVHSRVAAQSEMCPRIVRGKIARRGADGAKLLAVRTHDADASTDAVAVAFCPNEPHHQPVIRIRLAQ